MRLILKLCGHLASHLNGLFHIVAFHIVACHIYHFDKAESLLFAPLSTSFECVSASRALPQANIAQDDLEWLAFEELLLVLLLVLAVLVLPFLDEQLLLGDEEQ